MKTIADIEILEEAQPAHTRLGDFYELTKPRMNFLVVITTMVGFFMASRGEMNWLLLFHTVLGTAMTASAAAVINQLIERRYDALMPRTLDRPIPADRITLVEAGIFATVLTIAGPLYLAIMVNGLTAMLGIATVLLYVLIYTPLKRITSLNTVVGAVPGAIPPVMGFTAVHGALSIEAISVFAILFFWQMPHFLAIAIMYKRDYQAGGFKMLPCVDEKLTLTSRMILLYAVAMLPITLLPSMIGMTGAIYFTAAMLLGLAFLSCAISCATSRQHADARQLFFASIIYLPLLLGFMMFDKIS